MLNIPSIPLYEYKERITKVQAAMKFVGHDHSKKAIITSLDKAIEALEGKTGTVITFE